MQKLKAAGMSTDSIQPNEKNNSSDSENEKEKEKPTKSSNQYLRSKSMVKKRRQTVSFRTARSNPRKDSNVSGPTPSPHLKRSETIGSKSSLKQNEQYIMDLFRKDSDNTPNSNSNNERQPKVKFLIDEQDELMSNQSEEFDKRLRAHH